MAFAMAKQPRRLLLQSGTLLIAAVCASCARLDTKSEVDVKPIEVKPIHVVVDVNVRIDRQLDNFFDFEKELASMPLAPVPATQPATTQTAAGIE